MTDFSKWMKYVTKATEKNYNLKHMFYRLTDFDIKDAQEKLTYRIPRELEIFYKQVGYGFLCCEDNEFIDRIIDPNSIVELINNNIVYLNTDKLLPFFEISNGCYITINIKTGKIFYFDNVIAESLTEFLDKMDKEPDYYINY